MFRPISTFPNWQDIKSTLKDIAATKFTATELVQKILLFKTYSHMARMKNTQKQLSGKFPILLLQYGKQLPQIYAKAAAFLLKRPGYEIPIFKTGQGRSHLFNKQQILYLFCSMLMCLIPEQQFDCSVQERSKWNFIMDFSFIFEHAPFKTNTVMEYLKTELQNQKAYSEKFIINRNVEKRSLQEIIKEYEKEGLSEIEIKEDTASIEEFYGCIKADFANQYLGGGSLMTGCVQEEIMFANHPQLFISQLLCQRMAPNEAIHLIGFKKYSKNRGYGHTVTYDGQEDYKYKYDENNMAMQYITAIDAVPIYDAKDQFGKDHIDRELLKAYAGFNFEGVQSNTVATGNWGCGVFRGDLRTKFLIQWLACSLAKKKMLYCPYGNKNVIENEKVINRFKKMTIGESYKTILEAAEQVRTGEETNIYEFL